MFSSQSSQNWKGGIFGRGTSVDFPYFTGEAGDGMYQRKRSVASTLRGCCGRWDRLFFDLVGAEVKNFILNI
jgi:hypothetical protein